MACSIDTATRLRLSRIIKAHPNAPWEVCDVAVTKSGKQLYLCHYTTISREDKPDEAVAHIRGLIVSPAYDMIVAHTFRYEPRCLVDGIAGDEIHFVDEYDIPHSLDLNRVKITRFYDNVRFVAFFFDGEFFLATGRKIRPESSGWGNTKPFIEMLQEVDTEGVLTKEKLFPHDEDFSPYCYIFLIVHRDLLVSTRQKMTGSGYIVYAGYRLMDFECKSEISEAVRAYEMTPLTPGEAKTYLSCGVHHQLAMENGLIVEGSDDIEPCIDLGEVLYVEDGEDVYRLESPGAQWRREMRCDDPELYHVFFRHMDSARTGNTTMYHLVNGDITADALREAITTHGGVLSLMWDDTYVADTREKKERVIWLNFVVSLPLSRQLEATDFLDRYHNDISQVISWIQSLLLDHVEIERRSKTKRGKTDYHHVLDIIQTAQNQAHVATLIHNTIWHVLYRIVRAWRHWS
jgi:hypothetical protein